MRPFFARLSSAIAVAIAVAVAACSSGPRDLPSGVVNVTPSPGVGIPRAPDAGSSEGGTVVPTIDAGQEAGVSCLPQANFSLDGAYGGTLAMRGTISFPAPLPAQRVVVVSVVAQVGGDVRFQAFATAAASDRYTFRVGGLVTGKYILRVQADALGNGTAIDPGDYDGYFNGSAAGPILVRADAVPVDLKTDCLDKVDFGAGVKP